MIAFRTVKLKCFQIIQQTVKAIRIKFKFHIVLLSVCTRVFSVACIVAIWIICNEIISILENIKDMGVTIPAFLIPLVTHVKSQVEDKVNIDTEKEDSEGE